MSRERQSVESAYAKPWTDFQPGDMIEGTYLGFTMVPSKRKDQKPFKSYNIKNDKGEYIGVSGAMVGSKLSRVPTGTYVWITFKGMTETNNGEAKDFNVECEKGTKLLDPVAASQNNDDEIPF